MKMTASLLISITLAAHCLMLCGRNHNVIYPGILRTAKPVSIKGMQVKSVPDQDWYLTRFKTQKIKAIRLLSYSNKIANTYLNI